MRKLVLTFSALFSIALILGLSGCVKSLQPDEEAEKKFTAEIPLLKANTAALLKI